MSMRYRASIVICSHSSERLPLLRQALRSVLGQSVQGCEVILVIDHNPELEMAIGQDFPDLMVLPNTHRRGLSGARNTGIGMATGDIVAFLDDDAVAPADWVERLLGHYEDINVMGVGGRIDAVWPNARPYWWPREFDWVVGCSYQGLPEIASPVRNLIGCNMSFRRAIFSTIGLFPEGQGRDGDNAAGCEETALCIRAYATFPNSRIIYDPTIAVQHILSTKRQSWSYFWRRCVAEGRSKALLARTLGTKSSLASEKRYIRNVLPRGVGRGLADVVRGDLTGLFRATTISGGLVAVAFGYVASRARMREQPTPLDAAPFMPIRILDVSLDALPSVISAIDEQSGVRYGGAFCAVRSKGRLVRLAEVPLYGEDVPVEQILPMLSPQEPPSWDAPPAVDAGPAGLFVRVIVATRDRPDQLARCLNSLLVQRYRHFEIIVVDNCPSNDETRELLERDYRQYENVHYRCEARAGLGHAHNAGLVGNRADIVAFTDDDVRTDPYWLSAIVRNFVVSRRVGCVTGMILPAELNTRAQYWTERHGGFGKGLRRRVFDLKENRLSDPLFPFAAGLFGSGANMAFSREALNSVKGFDGALGAGTLARGGDDLAAFVSVIQAGYQIVYEPQAILWHHHRREVAGMERQAYGYGVGLGAFLTKFLVERPGTIWHYVKALPAGVRHLVSNSSSKNAKLPDDYPSGLRWRERLGILAGVPAYFRSRASFKDYLRLQNFRGGEGI